MMKISNLSKIGIRDSSRIKDIERYLEQEIEGILQRKSFQGRELNSYNSVFDEHDMEEYSTPKKRYHSTLKSEEYLPFNKEELRPVVKKEGINSGRVEHLIMERLMPNIEDWLDDNLERIAHKVVKKYIVEYLEEDDANQRRSRRKSRYD
jgi:hypothetical protein